MLKTAFTGGPAMDSTRRSFIAGAVTAAGAAATLPVHAAEVLDQRGGGREMIQSFDSANAKAEVLGLDQKIADAFTHGDTAFVASVTPADFVMVHGDGWTNGGEPLATDTKESMLRRVSSKY